MLVRGMNDTLYKAVCYKRACPVMNGYIFCFLIGIAYTEQRRLKPGFSAEDDLASFCNTAVVADIRYFLQTFVSGHNNDLINTLGSLKSMCDDGHAAERHKYLIPAHALRVSCREHDGRTEIIVIRFEFKYLIYDRQYAYPSLSAEHNLLSTPS